MNLNTLLDLAIMIFAGMFCGRMAKQAVFRSSTSPPGRGRR